ncbi:MAG: sugar phosphate isomerase/epimerase and 4-hydroxyphenylpyruvate domain-containing protein [Proteobacteria bacterium]|nr:sugar phosphate isomerase/epimerase and 4-hydroxyphenylpyruvate domain-containing protein [Pseudomonadota bacterium]
MLTSIATVSLSGTLESKLRAIAHARFDGAEIFENDLLTARSTAREVAGQMHDLGLACTVFQPFRDFEGMPDELRGRTFDRLERKFDLMQELGAPLLLVCSSVSPAASGDRSRIVADLRELAERAARRDLRVGYEALAWGRHVFDHRDAWAVVKEVGHPALGLILDSFHSLARAIPLESLREIDPSRIFIVQLADAPIVQMDYLSWSRHFRNMPGQGELPLVEFVATLLATGYAGPLSLEIFNDQFRATSASTVALDGHRSLTFLFDQAARRLAPRFSPELPSAIKPRGFEFVEFAANEEESGQLQSIFTALGFRRVGRHKSKNVARWRQNRINFVINSEPESFARAYDAVHGASVCAVGVSVNDISAALARAEGLQIPRLTQPIGPGQLVMPSVQGLGGSLLYFMEAGQERAIWDSEFLATEDAGPDAGLVSIDHLAQTMPYEEVPSWVLYYISLFELSKTPVLEIADPLGLVQTRALESADGGLRLVLNASPGSRTLSARFVQGYHGAGLQHIALATRDIIASARRLRSLGLATLPIPPNYYEDLAARFALEPTLLHDLQELDILYDRDSGGEYFQLVSRAFAKRFFFEIVERRGYRGYGVPNAPIRLAAQSQYRDDIER